MKRSQVDSNRKVVKSQMKIEVRADGAHISGYVNVVERKSRPVITPHGKVVEEIESRAFEQAINRAGNITVTVDHDSNHVYASTDEGTLKLYEDNIGLHADVLITDETLIDLAKKGKNQGLVIWICTTCRTKWRRERAIFHSGVSSPLIWIT